MMEDVLRLRRMRIVGTLIVLAFLGVAIGRAEVVQGSSTRPPAKQPVTKGPTAPTATQTPKKKPPVKGKTPKGAAAQPAASKKPAPSGAQGPLMAGRRDPFRLPTPVVAGASQQSWEEITGPLPPGIRGLVVSQLRLEGLVREDLSNTMIAIVTNNTNRAYFLREKDEVYHGVVSKITIDVIYFKVEYHDAQGKVQTREVAIRLGSGPGGGR